MFDFCLWLITELQFSTSYYFTFLSGLPCELQLKQKKRFCFWKCRRGIRLKINADQEKDMVLVDLTLSFRYRIGFVNSLTEFLRLI